LLERIVGGFFCLPVLSSDPWLQDLRRLQRFTAIFAVATERRAEAERLWRESGVDRKS
jgi:hypothetical protein